MDYKNKFSKWFMLSLLLFLVVSMSSVYAQINEDFYQNSTKNQQNGMYALGSWALINLGTGAIGWARGSGADKYFHQMNFFWNTVNLGIAGFAIYNTMNTAMPVNTADILNNHIRNENILLVNAGLDVVYMSAGYFMRWKSFKTDKNNHLLEGYGNSIMLQGGFLFVFDLILYGMQRVLRLNNLYIGALHDLQINGLVLTYQF